MKKARIVITLLLILAISAGLAGCGGQAQPKEAPKTTPAPKPTKSIVFARASDSDNLDPVIQDGNPNIWIFNLVMEGLIRTTNDGKGIESCLAEKWEFNQDKTVLTFTLRKGIKFSDGTPVTAQDWVFSLDRARLTKESPWQFSLEAVKEVKAPDPDHLQIVLKTPWAPILADLAMFNATVTSEAYFKKVGLEGFSQKPLGTGPYYFVEWKKGEYITLKKNPNYWQKDVPIVDDIKFVVVPEDNTRIMQLQGGTVDLIDAVPWSRIDELKKDPNLQVVLAPSTSTTYLVLNNAREPFKKAKVRQALVYATDRDALVKTILFGCGQVAVSFRPPDGPMYNSKLQPKPYDPEKAKQLLIEAGYPKGFKTTMMINPAGIVNVQIATILKEQWAKVGIELSIIQYDGPTLSTKRRESNYDITTSGWTDDIVDPSQEAEYMCVTKTSKNFWTNWNSQEADTLAQQGKSEGDTAKRQQIYDRIQEMVYNEVPLIPLYHTPYPVGMRKGVTGFIQTPLGNYRFEKLDKASGK